MRCDECAHWQKGTLTTYSAGDVVTEWFDRPKCAMLGQETPPEFFCAHFLEGIGEQIVTILKEGHIWQNWVMIPCPECQGPNGQGGNCHRCAGTGNVRKYDDGYIGDEQTRKHPKENMQLGQPLLVCECNDCGAKWTSDHADDCPDCMSRNLARRPFVSIDEIKTDPGTILAPIAKASVI